MPHQTIDQRNRNLGRMMRRKLTPAEFALWRKLSNRNLEGLRFRRQAPVGPYLVDFFCPEAKLAVEIDGGQHFRYGGLADDAVRTEWLTAHGVRVVRFTNSEVTGNLDGVCAAIMIAASAR